MRMLGILWNHVNGNLAQLSLVHIIIVAPQTETEPPTQKHIETEIEEERESERSTHWVIEFWMFCVMWCVNFIDRQKPPIVNDDGRQFAIEWNEWYCTYIMSRYVVYVASSSSSSSSTHKAGKQSVHFRPTLIKIISLSSRLFGCVWLCRDQSLWLHTKYILKIDGNEMTLSSSTHHHANL